MITSKELHELPRASYDKMLMAEYEKLLELVEDKIRSSYDRGEDYTLVAVTNKILKDKLIKELVDSGYSWKDFSFEGADASVGLKIGW
jgi:hypothetical protein